MIASSQRASTYEHPTLAATKRPYLCKQEDRAYSTARRVLQCAAEHGRAQLRRRGGLLVVSAANVDAVGQMIGVFDGSADLDFLAAECRLALIES